ncbi:LptA/OstA family protein [Actibacterium sp. 188UL27-1]|uniref:LptA/OstA family protein n=1 Tax=Actibacterium sp. 188UL27-1 TaxID=2786961 RepID=UPI0019581975|nr:LptA/OstA family protein [Actibacterium sp. 188UL27-1]MBM7067136.1 LptA/OstA family protein [Actibacterium sp. 188UL27-1]
MLRQLLFAGLLGLLPVSVSAQGATVAFGGLQHDSSLPVEIAADSLEIDQASGAAVFKGNVKIGQGEMRLSANTVDVNYADGDNGSGEIERLHAKGDVTLVSGEEVAEAQDAVYTIDSGTIVMTGDVILTQGRNALSAQRLDISLDDGNGVMTGGVRVILQSGADE